MLLLHTADLHIGESRNILPDTYLDRQKKMLYQILDLMRERKIKFLTICGDIFHRSDPSQEEKDMFIKWLVKVDDFCIENDSYTIIISGNHDSRTNDKTSLDTIKYIKPKLSRIVLALKPSIHVLHNYAFACVPWDYELDTTVIKLHKKLDTKVKKFFVLGHLPLPGITTDTGWFINGQHRLLDLSFVSAFFLGDIHARSISPCFRLQMAGAPIQHTWSDKLPKGVSLIDLNSDLKPQLIELDVVKFEVTKDLEKAKKSKHIVKYVGQVGDEDLPENVVEVVNYLNEEEVTDYISEFDVTEGLAEFLAEKGYTKEQQNKALKFVEKLCKDL